VTPRPVTAREIAEQADVSKRHVHDTPETLVEAGVVDDPEAAGPHGATLYSDDGLPTRGIADITGEDGEIADSLVWSSYTWSVVVCEPEGTGEGGSEGSSGGEPGASEIWRWETPIRVAADYEVDLPQ